MPDDSEIRVLFVCMGNICRSPTAHGVFQAQVRTAGLERWIDIDSAGTHGFHAGLPPDRRAIRAAAERGYDLSDLRARQVEAADLERFHYVLAMDHANLQILEGLGGGAGAARPALLLDFAGHPRGREVPDPYYGTANGFDEVLDLVEEGCAGLLETIRRGRGW